MQPEPQKKHRAKRTTHPSIGSLSDILGAHPDALADLYQGAPAADPKDFAGPCEGRILGVTALTPVHMLLKSVVAFGSRHLPWEGVSFESGGTGGTNLVFGRSMARFRCEIGASLWDNQPALLLRYDGFDHAWPVKHFHDELRMVGPQIAIGPTFYLPNGTDGGIPNPTTWWGIAPRG